MKTTKLSKYLFIRLINNPKKTFKINRDANYQKGDLVAVDYGNTAKVERFNNQAHVIGKAVAVEMDL